MGTMAQVRLVFTLSLYFVVVAAAQSDIRTKTIALKKFAQCGGNGGADARRKLRVLVEDVIIASGGGGRQSLSARFNVKEDLRNQFDLKMDLRKCDVNGNPDHCEYVMKNYNLPNICSLICLKGEASSVFVENIDKPLECPIEKNIYTLNETTITNEMLAFVPFGNAIWKMQLNGFESETAIFCLEVEVLVKIIRARTGRGRRQWQ